MKIVKYLFFLLLLACVGTAVYVATIDGEFQVEESRIIDAPDELLFTTINEYRTWEKWGPWMDESDEFTMEYPDKTSGEGAFYNWKSETQPDGKMETLKVIPFSGIDQKLTMTVPFIGEIFSDVYWKFEKIEGKKTKVTWGTKGEQSFMQKMYGLSQDSTMAQMIQPMYARGLEKLDQFVNEKMKKYTVHVDGVTEHGGGFYMYSATAASITMIPEKTKEMLPAVSMYMKENNLPQTGMPFILYNEFNADHGTSIFSVAIPTRDKVVTPKESAILCDFLPRQKVVKTTLKGDYTNLKEAWETAYKYIADNNLEVNTTSPPFEVCRVDPNLQPNPAEWVTEIYIPIL